MLPLLLFWCQFLLYKWCAIVVLQLIVADSDMIAHWIRWRMFRFGGLRAHFAKCPWFFILKWKQQQQQKINSAINIERQFSSLNRHPIRHEYAVICCFTATIKYNSSILIQWLCSSEVFFSADFKMFNCIKLNLPAMVFFRSFGVCHWWQHTANNGKKPANVINFLKSFVQFLFPLLILLLLFSTFMTFNERYFNDDLVIIVCYSFVKFSAPIFTPFQRQWNEMRYQWLNFLQHLKPLKSIKRTLNRSLCYWCVCLFWCMPWIFYGEFRPKSFTKNSSIWF